MNFLKYRLLLLLITIIPSIGFSQNNSFDTANVILNAKLNIVSFESSNKNREDIINIIDSKVKYKVIESKGFNDYIVFFKLITEPCNKLDSNNFFYEPLNQFKSDFIFAFNSKNLNIYKLKGFKENDFKLFYNHLNSYLNLNISSSYDLETKKRFLKTFYVEGLDLDCLYKSLKIKKKKDCRCLQPNDPIFDGVVW